MNLLVMLPTYNERENIETTLEQLFALPLDVRVLVVDDLSPDGTGQLAEQLKARYPHRLQIIHRQGPRGRGRAGIAAFQCIAQMEGLDWVVEMDADGSHQPKDIPALLKAGQDADVVVGSRYISGGGIQGWSLFRHINSRVAGLLARLLLGISVRDVTSGFRLFRHEVVRRLPWSSMISDNPSIVEEILYHCVRGGYRIVEAPIVFIDRQKGRSKFSLRLVWRWLYNLWRVRTAQ